jgi:hypothetical protein
MGRAATHAVIHHPKIRYIENRIQRFYFSDSVSIKTVEPVAGRLYNETTFLNKERS